MSRYNIANRSFQQYEKHLSPFGRIVLDTLIRQSKKALSVEQNKNDSYHSIPTQYKRVLTFSNHPHPVVSTQYCPAMQLIPCKSTDHNDFESKLNLTKTMDVESAVPSSVDIIQTVPINTSNRNDFVHPIIASNKILLHDIYNKDDENICQEVSFFDKAETNVYKQIAWDEIFDSELFPDTSKDYPEKNKGINHSFNRFEITFPKENAIKTVCKDANNSKKRITKQITNPKAKKVRNDNFMEKNVMNTNDSASFKNKKNTEKLKTIFRKQKYTKTVKNWLDNVEPHENVDDVNVEMISNNDSNMNDTHLDKPRKRESTYGQKGANIDVEKYISTDKSANSSKKVVQAQLANKDGVMKFSKPKTVNANINKDMQVEEHGHNNKEKKVKKFVPPIKSQIPVKDLTYEIYTLDQSNIENYSKKLCSIKDNEIIVMLTYRNGFCQLNSHHTDGSCAPDGLIIHYDDMFYCFKSADQKVKFTLKNILENNKVICYEGRVILIYLAVELQMQINPIDLYDTKIGASLLDPDNPPENFTELQKLLSFTPPFTIATECTLQKAAWYMSLLRDCWMKLYNMLIEDSLWKVFVDIEMKLLPIVTDMGNRGVLIDLDKLKTMEEVLLTRMKQVEQQCYEAAGKVFQINSAVQVRAILYDELQLDTKCNVKIRETISKGAKSTSETMLRSLMADHPLPKLILEYRHLHKAHATFLMGVAQHVQNGVVKPTWVQIAAATGRIASNNPNLQAIPKAPFSLVMFPDADNNDSTQVLFRSVYICRPGHSLLSADFKHVECRVFAHSAADNELLNTLTSADDLFRVLAATWLKKPESEIVSEERERTKRLVYASLYGAGTRRLMEILDVSYEDALQISVTFNRTFPSLKSFGRGVVSRCSQQGGRLTTLCGRVRKFNNINSEDFALKSHAERQAVNFIVQGSAADLCKIAMIDCVERLRSMCPPVEARLVLQIHDELVWEVPRQHVHLAADIIKQVMEGCGRRCGMSVSLSVAINVGESWGTMEEYTPPSQ